MTLSTGTKLSHYEITSQIGKGGMGEVYQAKDTKLGRDVAIKVLPEEFAKDADRVARLQREAKLLASLNHPNIAAIYGLEESDGTNFLVMELVKGQTLDERIKSSAVPVEEALKLALQIAEALEAAHEKSVIHRDLKPANIKVTPDGKVKVLDFGLAKAFAGEQADLNLSNSPTLSVAATQQGMILGTAAYMSPEQARGKEVDKRADIWAFGVVLFEMLTGKQVFTGDTVSDTLASVLAREPEWQSLPQNLHPRIRLLLERCLKKESKDRYSGISDARVDIQEVLADPHGVFVYSIAAIEPKKGQRVGLIWVASALVVGAIIAGAAVWKFKPTEPDRVVRFEYELPEGNQLNLGTNYYTPLAVSPDGSRFVYGTANGLYIRSMDALEARIIEGTDRNSIEPFFSGDGQWIGCFSGSDQKLKKVAVTGGPTFTLGDSSADGGFNWDWDDRILHATGEKIMWISSNGGNWEPLMEQTGGLLGSAQMLPDGESVLFTDHSSSPHMVKVHSLKSGENKELLEGVSARYVETGHIVYGMGSNLYAVPFDIETLEVTAKSVPVVEGVFKSFNFYNYDISNSGTLVYIPGIGGNIQSRQLVWVDRDGTEEVLEAPFRAYVYAHLSPDGTQVALDIRDQESDIWIWDFSRKHLSRLTFDPGLNRGGVWTPDGKKVAFSAEREGAENIYWQAADGSGAPEPLTEISDASILPIAFSPDGRQLLSGKTEGLQDISILNLDGSDTPRVLLGEKEFNEQNPQISPDGRWLAYQSDESGSPQIWVRPFPDTNAGRWQITTEGGTRPLWNRNGRELFYYVESEGAMMAVPVATDGSFKAGTPTELFRGDYLTYFDGTQYSVTSDGKRFLMIKIAETEKNNEMSRKINIVLNWFEELKAKVPVP